MKKTAVPPRHVVWTLRSSDFAANLTQDLVVSYSSERTATEVADPAQSGMGKSRRSAAFLRPIGLNPAAHDAPAAMHNEPPTEQL